MAADGVDVVALLTRCRVPDQAIHKLKRDHPVLTPWFEAAARDEVRQVVAAFPKPSELPSLYWQTPEDLAADRLRPFILGHHHDPNSPPHPSQLVVSPVRRAVAKLKGTVLL